MSSSVTHSTYLKMILAFPSSFVIAYWPINIVIIVDLRKQARQLENEIDLKLVAFSKLEAGIKTPHNGHSDTVPLLSGEDTFEVMSAEIEDLLKKVTNYCNSTYRFLFLFWHSWLQLMTG